MTPAATSSVGVISAETVRRFSHSGWQTPLPEILVFRCARIRNRNSLTAHRSPGNSIQPYLQFMKTPLHFLICAIMLAGPLARAESAPHISNTYPPTEDIRKPDLTIAGNDI